MTPTRINFLLGAATGALVSLGIIGFAAASPAVATISASAAIQNDDSADDDNSRDRDRNRQRRGGREDDAEDDREDDRKERGRGRGRDDNDDAADDSDGRN